MRQDASKTGLSRETLLPRLAAHVLDQGMTGASLRPLAKAAGTSDRMLIYHFGNKERLIEELLRYIAEQYATALDNALSEERSATREQLLERILTHTSSAQMEPFLALWWEIVAGCARETPGYLEAAQSVMDRLLAWLEVQMPKDDPDPQGGARYLLTLIEGTQMLDAIGRGHVAKDGLAARKR